MCPSRIALCSTVLALAMAIAGTASAQTPPSAGGTNNRSASAPSASASSEGAGDQVQATVRTEGGRRVYVASSTIEVRGEIQRPYAFSLSGRSSLGYTYFETPVHFVQEIIDAVRRTPF